MTKIRYFNGTDELKRAAPFPNAKFAALGGVKSRANWVDSYSRLVGVSDDGRLLPVERAISYKAFPSRHECNAKCMGGKINGTCECQCGGKNHGIGMFTQLLSAA